MQNVTSPANMHLLAGAFGALSGIAAHLGLFNRGEWHVYSPDIARWYFALCATVSVAFFVDPPSAPYFGGLASALLGHLTCLCASILVYRGLFHPLGKLELPGPRWARFTKLGHVWASRHSRNHLYLHQLHQKYGDNVRTGEK